MGCPPEWRYRDYAAALREELRLKDCSVEWVAYTSRGIAAKGTGEIRATSDYAAKRAYERFNPLKHVVRVVRVNTTNKEGK